MKLLRFKPTKPRLGLFDNYLSDPNKDNYTELGEIVASISGGNVWSKCWCGKEKRSGGCRHCQTYQLMYGLDPTCGNSGALAGKPLKNKNNSWDADELDEDLLKIQEELQKER